MTRKPSFPARTTRPLLMLALLLATLYPMAQAASETTTANAAPKKDQTVRVTADQQIYDIDKQQYQLKGNVKARFKNLDISSSEAVMEMDSSGKPTIARFLNRPTAKRLEGALGQDTMTADVIRIHMDDSSFGAEGNVLSYITTVAADPFTIRADTQQFDNKNGMVRANGSVSVDYKGSQAYSPSAYVRMGDNGKAERAVFTGGARIKQKNSVVNASKITVMVDSGNLIAESGVRTRVTLPPSGNNPGTVLIDSDYQQYDKASDKMIASGNVKLVFGDYVATGPKATFNLADGGLKEIFLTGRSTIIEQGRKITADKITITTNPKNFDAVGNVQVQFQAASGAGKTAKPAPAKTPAKGGAGTKPPVKPEDGPDTSDMPEDNALDY